MSSPDVMNLLEKADRSLAAAGGHLLMHGFPEFAVGRAYYAMLIRHKHSYSAKISRFPSTPP